MHVWCERFVRTSGPKRLPAAPWMNPSRPERSAVWQRTSTRPAAGPEAAAHAAPVASSAATLPRPLTNPHWIMQSRRRNSKRGTRQKRPSARIVFGWIEPNDLGSMVAGRATHPAQVLERKTRRPDVRTRFGHARDD